MPPCPTTRWPIFWKSLQLLRISAEVDGDLEIAEITRRVAEQRGPALLFDRVRGRSLAVVTNLLGTPARACRALGLDSLDEMATRVAAIIEQNTPQNWFDRLKMSADDGSAGKLRPKAAKAGVCQQVVRLGRDVDLATFPLLKAWPGESGPAITAGTLITEDRQNNIRGATLTPLVALDENRLAVVDDGHSVFSRHWSAHRAAGQRLPLAVVVGGDPIRTLAASLELPAEIDFYHLCGLLRTRPLEVVKCRTHGLEVPAEADFVFEGYLDPEVPDVNVEAAAAAGSHYRVSLPSPVFHLTAVTHRSRPLFPAIIDSGSTGEAGVLVQARERMLVPLLRSVAPDLVDLYLTAFGGWQRVAFVSIRKQHPFQARQIAAALWGTNALRFTKFLVLVDERIDVHNIEQVLGQMGAHVAPERDLFSLDGPAHASDHANTLGALARHVAIDATTKLPAEQSTKSPSPLDAGHDIRQQVTARWPEYRL